jgi:hypothetical protein
LPLWPVDVPPDHRSPLPAFNAARRFPPPNEVFLPRC